MRNNMLDIARIFALSGAVLSSAIPLYALAEEKYICATVSEILETESEDCLYFVVKGDFVLKDNSENELSICLDNGTDTKKNIELVDMSFEKKKKIYILVDGDSVREIKSSCPNSGKR